MEQPALFADQRESAICKTQAAVFDIIAQRLRLLLRQDDLVREDHRLVTANLVKADHVAGDPLVKKCLIRAVDRAQIQLLVYMVRLCIQILKILAQRIIDDAYTSPDRCDRAERCKFPPNLSGSFEPDSFFALIIHKPAAKRLEASGKRTPHPVDQRLCSGRISLITPLPQLPRSHGGSGIEHRLNMRLHFGDEEALASCCICKTRKNLMPLRRLAHAVDTLRIEGHPDFIHMVFQVIIVLRPRVVAPQGHLRMYIISDEHMCAVCLADCAAPIV